jgi:predicted secreted Zn-dependent protease
MPKANEPRPAWRKSTKSFQNSACVEVAILDHEVLVRHSKRPAEQLLSFTHHEWKAFIVGVQQNEFNID